MILRKTLHLLTEQFLTKPILLNPRDRIGLLSGHYECTEEGILILPTEDMRCSFYLPGLTELAILIILFSE